MGIRSYQKFKQIDRESLAQKARELTRRIRLHQQLQMHFSMLTVSQCAAGFGAIMLAVSVIIQLPEVNKIDPAKYTALGIVVGLIFIIFSIQILNGSRLLTIRRKRIFALIAVISSITAVLMNGVVSLPWIPAGIVFIHLLLPYRQSLYASFFILVAITAALDLHGHNHGYEVIIGYYLRVVGASLSVLLMMQLIMRQISDISNDSVETTGGLNNLISTLEKDLQVSLEDKDKASSEDPESGLINLYGIARHESDLLKRMDSGEKLIIAAIRCNKFSDSISTLPDKERYLILSNTIKRIQSCLGEQTVLARVSRNDYIAILSCSELDKLSTLFDNFKEPISHGQTRIVVSPSVGYERWQDDCRDISLVVRKAEIALAVASEHNRVTAVPFDDGMLNKIIARNDLLNDLSANESMSQFELEFQPIVNLRSGDSYKFEALIRWNHPLKGRIPPNNFIPLAESSTLIYKMTDWVIASAYIKLVELRDTLGNQINISVNIPAAYLENGTVDKSSFISGLKSISTSFKGMILEITEGSMLRITPELTELMNDLRKLDFEFALDDFGVGHSSLSQLERIPLSYLKIDKSFVDKIETSRTKYFICNTIIKVAHQLRLKVVAEGIENEQQHELLRKAKCDYGQGYLFSKPISAGLIFEFMTSRSLAKSN